MLYVDNDKHRESLSSSSIDYLLTYNVCESDTSAGDLTVPFAVTCHMCSQKTSAPVMILGILIFEFPITFLVYRN